MVVNASDVIAPVWPMKTIIACNPLQGLENMSFKDAVQKGNYLFEGKGFINQSAKHDSTSKKFHLQYVLSLEPCGVKFWTPIPKNVLDHSNSNSEKLRNFSCRNLMMCKCANC